MAAYDSTSTKVPALSRTWEVVTDYRPYGEDWGSSTYTVTLTRTPVGLIGMVDSEPVELARAVSLLEGAASTRVISELIPLPASMARCLGVRG